MMPGGDGQAGVAVPFLPALATERIVRRADGMFSDAEQTRKEALLKAAEKECTAIGTSGLHIGGEAVAQDLARLRAAGITHVVNAAGLTIPNYFESNGDGTYKQGQEPGGSGDRGGGSGLRYLTFHLTDGGARRGADQDCGEDLRAVLPSFCEWVEAALTPPAAAGSGGTGTSGADSGGGGGGSRQHSLPRVLVHCQSGVSRSSALVCAYLMWREGLGYAEAIAHVKRYRVVASPNMAFVATLEHWHRLQQPPAAGGVLTGGAAAAAGVTATQPKPGTAWLYQLTHQAEANARAPMVARWLQLTAQAAPTPPPPHGPGRVEAGAGAEAAAAAAALQASSAHGLDPRGCYVVRTGGGGESFLRVHWVAVPKALRARRVNRRRRRRLPGRLAGRGGGAARRSGARASSTGYS
jgi:hypothetical protein